MSRKIFIITKSHSLLKVLLAEKIIEIVDKAERVLINKNKQKYLS